MKICLLAALTWLGLILADSLFAQTCEFSEPLTLESQAELNSFQEIHGPCSDVKGELIISGGDIVDLSPLSGIEEVEGQLTIQANPSLGSLAGFEPLGILGGLSIHQNNQLSDCQAMQPLLDLVDDGPAGPAVHPGTDNNLILPPDISGEILVEENSAGCNSMADIAPLPLVEKVMTGSWYDPASSGEGLMIHAASEWEGPIAGVSPGNIGLRIGYFYGYYPDGSRFWLIGTHTGPSDWSEPVEFAAIEALDGRFEGFDTTEVDLHEWGSFTVEMHSCEFATVRLNGTFRGSEEVVEKTLPVQRLGHVAGDFCSKEIPTDDTDSITGTWYDTAMSGQGFSIHKIREDWGIVYFYGFDQDRQPLWLIGVWTDPLALNQMVEVPMDKVTGGTFDLVDPDTIVTEHWGTMKLTMDQCYSGLAELEGEDGYQAFDLTQLAGSIDLVCPVAAEAASGE